MVINVGGLCWGFRNTENLLNAHWNQIFHTLILLLLSIDKYVNKHVFIIINSVSTNKGELIQPWLATVVDSWNMASINVNTCNWALECTAEK